MRISLTIAALIASNDAVEVSRVWDSFGSQWDYDQKGLYSMDDAVNPHNYLGQENLGNEFFT